MILLADSGSTKCDWIFVDQQKKDHQFVMQTAGLNPIYYTENEIAGIINNSNDFLAIKSHVEKIYFFGAGCGEEQTKTKMKNILSKIFYKASEIYITGDIEGAVYACTDSKAVIAILGTGSNACYFDGANIHYKLPSLGYSLMDDGGGNSIGRDCLRAYYFGKMPQELSEKFESQYNLDPLKVKESLYHGKSASLYLASFAPFAYENLNNEFIHALVEKQLRSFFELQLSAYKEYLDNSPIHFVGSVAHYFGDILAELCEKHNFQLGKIIQRPIKSLASNVESYSKLMG